MLVLLIPPAVDDLGQGGIVVGALEGVDVGKGFGGVCFGLLCRKTSVGRARGGGDSGGLGGRFDRVVEDALATGADALVDKEEVKVVVLDEETETG